MRDYHVPYDYDYYRTSELEKIIKERLNIYDLDRDELCDISNMFKIPVKFYDYQTKDGKWHKGLSFKKSAVNFIFNNYEMKRRLAEYLMKSRLEDIEEINRELDELRKEKPGWIAKPNMFKIKNIDPDDMTDMDNASRELLKNDDVFNENKKENNDLSDVESEWHPREGLFLEKDPKKIANYLIRNSKDKGQAMKRLTFYMNRAGENLENRRVLNKVKELLKSDD